MKILGRCSMLMVLTLATAGLFAQQKPVYKKSGEKIIVTHFYEDGTVKETGTYYKDVLHGKWVQYDRTGNVTFEANYDFGDKEGKWFKWDKEENVLYEMVYEDNTLVSVDKWRLEKRNLLAER